MFHPTEEVITLIAHFARKLSSRSLADFVLWLARLCCLSVWLRSPFEGSLARFGRGESR